ncbi:hypothetical protein TDIS_1590 [Thermosulfurimonas dismutans]|uniref:Uncharacterized protein n=1 Tax=Thermosulfurimonas dismutans TaxID=999894 RepID=A0A179D2V3_9BACT|nr:hypothetical protein TDIS_1590 [Thermosulfurimonas dismutans]
MVSINLETALVLAPEAYKANTASPKSRPALLLGGGRI